MELLLIPVLLISGAVLVYLGAGGGHPFNQRDPLTSTRSGLSQKEREFSTAPAGGMPVSDGTGPAAWPNSAEPHLIDEAEASEYDGAPAHDRPRYPATDVTSISAVEAPRAKGSSPQVTGPRFNGTPRLETRPNILVTADPQRVSAPETPATAVRLSNENLQSDVLLTDLLNELIEMRRELKEVGGKVDALFDAQGSMVQGGERSTAARPLPALKPARAEG